MAEGEKSEKKPAHVFPVQEKIMATHVRKSELGEEIGTEVHMAQEPVADEKAAEQAAERCMNCGKQMQELRILYCAGCRQRVLKEYDPDSGKYIYVPLGKDIE